MVDAEGYEALSIIIILISSVDLIFVCLQFSGIWLQKNILLGIYLGYRYTCIILIILILIIVTYYLSHLLFFNIIGVVLFSISFILDFGLTVILPSIRADRAGKQPQPQAFALSLYPQLMQQQPMQQMQNQQPSPHQQVAYNPHFNPSAPVFPQPTPSLGKTQLPVHGNIVP